MTKAKKTISVLLAIVMVLGTGLLTAFAAPAEVPTATVTVEANTTSVEVGQTVDVTVKLQTNYKAASTSVVVDYDAEAFELVASSVTPNDALFGAGLNATEAKVYDASKLGAGKVGAFFVAKKKATYAVVPAGTTLFTFQLKAIKAKAATLAVVNDQKTDTHTGGLLYCGLYDGTPSIVTTGQTFVLKNAAVEVTGGVVAAPELVLTTLGEESGVIIDRNSYVDTYLCETAVGYIYGIQTDWGDSIDLMVQAAEGTGSIVVNLNNEGAESTGASVDLLDNDGNVVETYFFVYFGDINGNGLLDPDDATMTESIVSGANMDYYLGDGTPVTMATDINGNDMSDPDDATGVEALTAGASQLMQNEIAAIVATEKGLI